MIILLATSASLFLAAGPPPAVSPSVAATVVPRFQPATLCDGGLARLGDDRFTLLRPIQSVGFTAAGKELMAWEGRTLYRWAFPSGQPLGRNSLPNALNPTGQPFDQVALCSRYSRVAWIRFRDDKERLRVWDFGRNRLVLDRDITLENKDLDYAGLAWSNDGKNLLAVINDQRVHVFDLEGQLVEKTRVTDGKHGWELPSGKPWRGGGGGHIQPGVTARIGKSRIHIAAERDFRESERRRWSATPPFILTFTDLDTGKKTTAELAPQLAEPGCAAVSEDGRHLALADRGRLRIWDVVERRELKVGTGFPEMTQMVVAPGGAYVQFQPERIGLRDEPWHSLRLDGGLLRRLTPLAPADGITLGLGAKGFAVGKDQFVGITGRSVNRWELKTGRCLDATPLPRTPRESDDQVGSDECLLLGDGFDVAQFSCIARKDANPGSEYRPTWRLWSQGKAAPEPRPIPDCDDQDGAAALPRGRLMYFATPTGAALSADKEVLPGLTFQMRGEMQMHFTQLDRPDSHRPVAFGGQWSELRGTSRCGHLLLVASSTSSWVRSSRNSHTTWSDPAAQRHALLGFHSGVPVGDTKKLAALIRDQASHLSPDGRVILAGGDGKLLIYEPHVLGKVVKEIPLPATPKRFASSKDGARIGCQLDDATLLILDGVILARFAEEAVVREIPKDLNGLAGELMSGSETAYRAVRLLAAAGDQGAAALRKVVDGRSPDAGQVAGWIRALDSNDAGTRNRAESALADWGGPVEKAVREAIAARPSAEQRLRLRRLISRFARSPYGNRELAHARAVLSLDWNASPAGARQLAEWAEKFPATVLGSESKAALADRSGR
ncbi:MAG: hypothetical protein ACRC33_24255 [Gemmataceae bacterium]